MTVSPCFVDCGQPACRKLGCIRVYNDRRWPCGCLKGVAPHGVGWLDCQLTEDERAEIEARLVTTVAE